MSNRNKLVLDKVTKLVEVSCYTSATSRIPILNQFNALGISGEWK